MPREVKEGGGALNLACLIGNHECTPINTNDSGRQRRSTKPHSSMQVGEHRHVFATRPSFVSIGVHSWLHLIPTCLGEDLELLHIYLHYDCHRCRGKAIRA